jgi:hypothetical protein
MDLTVPIVGILTYLGYALSEGPGETADKQKRKKISANDNPSGKNVYHSNFSKEIDIRERQIADSIFKKSKLPAKTGIIPPLYNTECTWACDKKLSEYVVFPEQNKIIQDHLVDVRRKKKDKSVIIDGPMFTRSMGSFSAVLENGPSISSSIPKSSFDTRENFDPEVSELTGLPLDMSHGNMVPFFGSNVKQNVDLGRGSSILDNHTGSGLDKIVKDSVVQMFDSKPEDIHGTRTFGDTIGIDRFVPSRFKQGEKLNQEIRVQPIPEAGLRPEYKSVDEMRVSGKEKIEFLKPLTSGKKFITDRGITGLFAKNRPDTYYDNDKLFTGAAEKTAPMSRSDYSETKLGKKNIVSGSVIPTIRGKDVNVSGQRQRLSRFGGNHGSAEGNAVMTSVRRTELEQDWIRNADARHEYDALDDFIHRDSYNPSVQERESMPSLNVGPVKSRIPETYPVLLDKPRTTNKELNLFTYSGPGGRATEGKESREQYENMEIKTHRESVVDTKGYVAGKNNKNSTELSGIGSHEFREDSRRSLLFNYHDSNKSTPSPMGVSEKLFGNNTNFSVKEDLETDFTERLVDKRLIEVLKNNPIATEFSRK